MACKKYYAVLSGRKNGIFSTWQECKEQVEGYAGAVFKSFPSLTDAENYLSGAAPANISDKQDDVYDIYVDGSFNQAHNLYGWGFAVFKDGQEVFADSGVGEDIEAAAMRNVAGELAAAMRAVKWAEVNHKRPIVLHHDYMGIGAWALKTWKANNKFTQSYAAFMATKLDWVGFHKVKGHTGVDGNERADQLAGTAIERAVNSLK